MASPTTTELPLRSHTTISPPGLSPSHHSLAAAATLNAGLQNEDRQPSSGSLGSPARERRRSSVRMNLSLNDPTMPAPGEMVTAGFSPGAGTGEIRPHAPWMPSSSSSQSHSPIRHNRAPSLGEIHQELENEQEAQVVCFFFIFEIASLHFPFMICFCYVIVGWF